MIEEWVGSADGVISEVAGADIRVPRALFLSELFFGEHEESINLAHLPWSWAANSLNSFVQQVEGGGAD